MPGFGVAFEFHEEKFWVTGNLPGERGENPFTVRSEFGGVAFEDRFLAAVKDVYLETFRREVELYWHVFLILALLEGFHEIFGNPAEHVELDGGSGIEIAFGAASGGGIFGGNEAGGIFRERREWVFEGALDSFLDFFVLRREPKDEE